MTEANAGIGESVRRLWAAFNKRDWDAFSRELDPEVEYIPVEEHVIYRGPEAVIHQYLERWLDAWEAFSGEAEEIESTPAEDVAFIAVRWRASGKGSGIKIDDRLFWVCEFRGGRFYRVREYSGRAEALKAAGLSE